MKRILLGFLMLALLLVNVSCFIAPTIEIGGDLMDITYDEKIVEFNTLIVIRQEEKFIVLIHDGKNILKKVEFNAGRSVLNCEQIVLKEDVEINKYFNRPFKELVKCFGEEHTDIGSGFYLPSYVTTDGYLLVFSVESGIISNVSKIDLLKT